MSRENILIKTSWISTIGNAILSASKIIIGLFTGSLAVIGDGIDLGNRCPHLYRYDFYGTPHQPPAFKEICVRL